MGGASTRVSNASKGLKKRGHELVVVTAFPHYPHGNVPKKYRTKAFIVQNLPKMKIIRTWIPPLAHGSLLKRGVLYLSFCVSALFALPLVLRRKVDVIWLVSPNYIAFLPGIVYKLFHIPTKVLLVLDVVDLWPDALTASEYTHSNTVTYICALFAFFSCKLSDRITTLTEAMKKRITTSTRVVSSKIFIVENVVDTNIFKPSTVEKSKNFSDKFVVMYIGNLGKAQDFDTILESAKILKDIDPDILFFVKGKGESESEIAKKIEKFKLRNVTFSNATVPLTKVPDYLNLADTLLLPLKKGFGNISFPSKLWEYLACKKPVIACVEGNIARFIENKKIGIVIAPSDGVALSRSILELKKSPQLGDIIATNGFTLVIKNLSLDIIAEKLLHCFERNAF